MIAGAKFSTMSAKEWLLALQQWKQRRRLEREQTMSRVVVTITRIDPPDDDGA